MVNSCYLDLPCGGYAGARAERSEPPARSQALLWARALLAFGSEACLAPLDIPAWTMSATREVEAFLSGRNKACVFHFGAGVASFWLARRASRVLSVEHDRTHLERMRKAVRPFPNLAMRYRASSESYIGALDECPCRFDLIVIDGQARAGCLDAAVPRLASGGMILMNDSGIPEHRAAIERSGLTETPVSGLAFGSLMPRAASILRR